MFGTLCGVSARAQPRTLARYLPLVEMTARMLSTLLATDESAQRLVTSSAASMPDGLT